MSGLPEWLELHRGAAPLIVSFPHTGTELPAGLEGDFVSPWLARRDAVALREWLPVFERLNKTVWTNCNCQLLARITDTIKPWTRP